MPRPKRCRKICCEPEYDEFAPSGFPHGDPVYLAVDEYETVRLIDYEGRTHEQCAGLMEVSRTTVTEIYERARHKIADCLVNGRRLVISGGNYRLCSGEMPQCPGEGCRRSGFPPVQTSMDEKGTDIMRIAVTYENGEVFQHFGHTAQFKIYDVQDGAVAKSQVVDTMGSGHGALAGFLTQNQVDTLICGGIGGGAQTALAQAGIRLFGGVSGKADDAVKALLEGSLAYTPDVRCTSHEHSCGEHSCGEEKHGCSGK